MSNLIRLLIKENNITQIYLKNERINIKAELSELQ